MDCKSTALCLFDEKLVQSDIISNTLVDYHPKTSITGGGPIEFEIPGSPDEYIDLQDTRLLLQLQIKHPDGSDLDAAKDVVCFANNVASTVFQEANFFINNIQVEGGQHLYPYKAYLSTLLQFHPVAKKSHMTTWGWYEDTPGLFDDAKNEGAMARVKHNQESKLWELYSPLCLDMTHQSRYLLPQTDCSLKLTPSKAPFALHVMNGVKVNYKYSINKCILYVRRMRVLDSVISGHNKGLARHNAIYPLLHKSIETFTITKDVRNHIKDSLFPGLMPRMLVVGFVHHEAFNGNYNMSPFNFQHFDVNKIGLYRNGELVPGQILQPDFTNGLFTQAYCNTMEALNYFNTDDGNGMTMEHFEKGYSLFVFDLTPDANVQAPYRNIVHGASLRLELQFEKALPTAINCILFPIYDAKLEITKLRDVLMTYTR